MSGFFLFGRRESHFRTRIFEYFLCNCSVVGRCSLTVSFVSRSSQLVLRNLDRGEAISPCCYENRCNRVQLGLYIDVVCIVKWETGFQQIQKKVFQSRRHLTVTTSNLRQDVLLTNRRVCVFSFAASQFSFSCIHRKPEAAGHSSSLSASLLFITADFCLHGVFHGHHQQFVWILMCFTSSSVNSCRWGPLYSSNQHPNMHLSSNSDTFWS